MVTTLTVIVGLPFVLTAPGGNKERRTDGAEPAYEGKPLRAWVEALQDRDVRVRARAARALLFAPKVKELVPPLIQALQDKEPSVRCWAVQALEDIGPDAEAAAPALTKLLDDDGPDYDVGQQARFALSAIGHPVDEINGLKMTLRIDGWEGEDRVRIAVAYIWTQGMATWAFRWPWCFIRPSYCDAKGHRLRFEYKSEPMGFGEGFMQGKEGKVEFRLTVPVPEGAAFLSIPDGSGLETQRVRLPQRKAR